MPHTLPPLSADRLRDMLDYDPNTGLFTRKKRTQRSAAGSVAGTPCRGYLEVNIDGRARRCHRLAFLWMTGSWPAGQVDHIDGDGTNNRWANLREATCRQNQRNRRGAQRNNKRTGVRGVTFNPRRYPKRPYHVKFEKLRKGYYFGAYATLDEARRVAESAVKELFGEFSGDV